MLSRAVNVLNARTNTYTHTFYKKKALPRLELALKKRNTYTLYVRLTLMYRWLPTELQRKLSKLLKVTCIIMIMQLCNAYDTAS